MGNENIQSTDKYRQACEQMILHELVTSENPKETARNIATRLCQDSQFNGLDCERNFGEPKDYAEIILEKLIKEQTEYQPPTLPVKTIQNLEEIIKPSTGNVLWNMLKKGVKKTVQGTIGLLPGMIQEYIIEKYCLNGERIQNTSRRIGYILDTTVFGFGCVMMYKYGNVPCTEVPPIGTAGFFSLGLGMLGLLGDMCKNSPFGSKYRGHAFLSIPFHIAMIPIYLGVGLYALGTSIKDIISDSYNTVEHNLISERTKQTGGD